MGPTPSEHLACSSLLDQIKLTGYVCECRYLGACVAGGRTLLVMSNPLLQIQRSPFCGPSVQIWSSTLTKQQQQLLCPTMQVTEFMEGGDLWTSLSQDSGEWRWNNRYFPSHDLMACAPGLA